MKCPDDAILQSYIDGELTREKRETIAAHIFSCALCHAAIQEIKSETILFDAAFNRALPPDVPTEQLRSRLDAALAAVKTNDTKHSNEGRMRRNDRGKLWTGFLAAFFSFSSQRRAAFASLAITALLVAFLLFAESRLTITQVAVDKPELHSVATAPEIVNAALNGNETVNKDATVVSMKSPADSKSVADRTHRAQPPTAKIMSAQWRNGEHVRNASPATAIALAPRHSTSATDLLPGEQSYLKAIASLSAALEANKKAGLPLPAGSDYKRDLAIVDEAIAATRRDAKIHPYDSDATEFLLAAYQSKLDLLDTIANASR